MLKVPLLPTPYSAPDRLLLRSSQRDRRDHWKRLRVGWIACLVPTPSDLREAAAAAGTLAAVAPADPVLGVLVGAPAEEENPAASWGAP